MSRAVFYRFYNPNSKLNSKKLTLLSKQGGIEIGIIKN